MRAVFDVPEEPGEMAVLLKTDPGALIHDLTGLLELVVGCELCEEELRKSEEIRRGLDRAVLKLWLKLGALEVGNGQATGRLAGEEEEWVAGRPSSSGTTIT